MEHLLTLRHYRRLHEKSVGEFVLRCDASPRCAHARLSAVEKYASECIVGVFDEPQ